MIALLGPPPKALLSQSNAMVQCKWPDAIENGAGKVCRNARDFFGGPFFNEAGMLFMQLVPSLC